MITFKPYELTNSSIKQQESKISMTQKTVTNQNIKIPDLYIPDPIPINPNSLANIQKVLEHIEVISGIKSRKRKWLPVVYDGVPYNQALKLKKNFYDLKVFARCQGYQTDNQLEFFQKCSDHHKLWDSICNIYRYSMALELIWPYVSSHNNPTLNGYLEWAKNQTNETYKLKFEQPHVREVIENVSVVSRSGLHNQHQGLDAVMEEINKALKSLISPVPSQCHWEIAARNFTNFTKQIYAMIRIVCYNSDVNHQLELSGAALVSLLQTGNDIWHPIPIMKQEADALKNENVMRKKELLAIINSVLVSIPETQCPKYTNLKNKTKAMLLTILQEIRDLNNANEIMNEENIVSELADEEIA
ncbi:hypothetical protein F8M41_007935 [Gigaspora margarita]|uniref:Uncharacterized protein n=1 Tax=Gigaspora margarita TaxID=4874 RepID=A0A8H4A2Q3_GIGMA|nr:hypothetical protein F8M41_007935 [Gigaspora margarita]